MKHLLAVASLLVPTAAHAEAISGPAIVIDGDTIDMTGTRIRLFGIDAPESAQTCQRNGAAWNCGEDAADLLQSLINGRTVTCERRDTDRYGRMVGICMAGTLDLSQAMVESGMAVALPRFSDAYVHAETRPRSLRLGIWGSDFQAPANYRAANPSSKPSQVPPPRATRGTRQSSTWRAPAPYGTGCAIKGNRNRRGQWIYHLPGMPYYEATRPEEIFCTEAEAQAAGYRRAIVR